MYSAIKCPVCNKVYKVYVENDNATVYAYIHNIIQYARNSSDLSVIIGHDFIVFIKYKKNNL